MTHPSPCDRLDAYLGGRLVPDEEAAFEAHAASCETCLGAADAEAASALAHLGAIACPPDVLDAALSQARRTAPDRAPRRRGALRTTRVWVGVAAALAVTLTALVWTTWADEEPRVAEVRPSIAPAAPRSPDGVAPAPEAPPAAIPEPAPTADVARAPAPPRRAAPLPRRQAAPRPAAVLPPAPEAAGPPPEIASADSVAVAREEVLLALAIVADAQDHTASAVADGVGRVSDALHATPTLLSPHTP